MCTKTLLARLKRLEDQTLSPQLVGTITVSFVAPGGEIVSSRVIDLSRHAPEFGPRPKPRRKVAADNVT
jgi:hypothetical protein